MNTRLSTLPFPAASLIDELLASWRAALGPAWPAYRNHCQRLYHLTRAFHPGSSAAEDRLIAVAAVFHDIGIWSHDTLDYLEPSARLALDWLAEQGDSPQVAVLVRAMIVEHHKLRAAGSGTDLVEAFRRADWTDVCQGFRRFGLERAVYHALRVQYPFLGFHTLLVKLGIRQLGRDPLHPLPMFRW